MWSIRTIDKDINVYRMNGRSTTTDCQSTTTATSFDIIEHLANQPLPLPVMEPPLLPLPPHLLPLFSNNAFPTLTHEMFCEHCQRTQVIVNDLREEIRKPDGDIDTGMHALGNDHDVRKLPEYVRLGNKMIEVYIEHEWNTLHTYYMTHEDADFSTPKCVIQEIEDDVMPEMQVTKLKPKKPVKGQSAKKLMLEWISEPNVGVVDHGQATQGTKEIGESSQPTSQTMTQPSVFVDSFYAASNPFLADNDFDPFLDLDILDVADKEVSQSVSKGKGVLEIIDEDEIAKGRDVDLDMIDNEEFESASDKDGLDIVRQRKLKQLRKQNKPKNSNVHKYYFYVRQEFMSGEQVKDRVHRHSIETRRELFLKKNDKQRVRAECMGKIHVFEPTGDDRLSQGAGPSQVNGPINESGPTPK
ncbi:mutator type transposase [Tanacetum coccineum]